MDDNQICIVDEQGQERIYRIVLTYDYKEKNYCIVNSDNEDDEEAYVFVYDEGGNLFPVENEEELEVATQVLEGFQSIDE